MIMEAQKIANLFGNADNESLKFATKKWYVINHFDNTGDGEGNEDVTAVKFEPKSLNQIFVIIQMHTFL